MFYKNLIKCQQASSSYLQVGKSLNLVLIRSRSKFKGKKHQDFSKVVYEDKNVPDPETTDFEPGEFKPRRLTYMPEGLPQHRGKKIKWWLKDRTPITVNVNPPEPGPEYVDKPNYPPIVEMSTGHMRSISEERETGRNYYKSIEKMPTYDQKLQELTELRPLKCIAFSSIAKLYNYLPVYKCVTRTHLIDNELPSAYNIEDAGLDELAKKIKPQLLNVIRNFLEFETVIPSFETATKPNRRRPAMQRLKKHEALIQNINNVCMRHLVNEEECGHLKESIVEINPEVRSWWWGSQFPPSQNIKLYQIYKVKKVNLSCQYQDYAPLNIRMNEPLVPILDQNDELVNQEVPVYPTHPFKLGWSERSQRISSCPGFLPPLNETIESIKSATRGDFPFLTYLNRELVNIRNEANIDDFNDTDDVVQSMAVMHNFAYLNAVANVHGFSTYSELTYPLTNQTIITDGQNWSFYVYQMNSHTFHSDLPNTGKQNLCWSINNVKLFESYEDGKFEGVNDEVIKRLIKMYIQKPNLTDAYAELRPHLSVDERSEEEKIKLRADMRRRFGQYRSERERVETKRTLVHKYEWVYVRNPESYKKFMRQQWRNPTTFPTGKIATIAYEYSDQKSSSN